MSNINVIEEIEVSNSPIEVFNAITEVTNWWSKDFEGASKEIGDVFTIYHPGQHYSKQKLVEVIQHSKIVWLVTDSMLYWLQQDKHEWTNTKMIFEIKPTDKNTVLQFIHEGLIPEMECYNMCKKGWNIIIKDWLKHFIETGTASPGMLKAGEIRNQSLAEHVKNKLSK